MAEIIIAIKVIPKSSQSQIVDWENGELKVRIAAIPDQGKANDALIAFLSKTLNISKSQIEIVFGKTGRHKRVRLFGLEEQEKNRVEAFLSQVTTERSHDQAIQ